MELKGTVPALPLFPLPTLFLCTEFFTFCHTTITLEKHSKTIQQSLTHTNTLSYTILNSTQTFATLLVTLNYLLINLVFITGTTSIKDQHSVSFPPDLYSNLFSSGTNNTHQILVTKYGMNDQRVVKESCFLSWRRIMPKYCLWLSKHKVCR